MVKVIRNVNIIIIFKMPMLLLDILKKVIENAQRKRKWYLIRIEKMYNIIIPHGSNNEFLTFEVKYYCPNLDLRPLYL